MVLRKVVSFATARASSGKIIDHKSLNVRRNDYAYTYIPVSSGVINQARLTTTNITVNNKPSDSTTNATVSFGNPDLEGVLPVDANNLFLATTNYAA
jgi:hypothetical protein